MLQQELEAQFHFVARNPRIGSDSSHLLKGMRRTNVRDYAIYHWPIAGRIIIMRAIHGARDIDATFFDDSVE